MLIDGYLALLSAIVPNPADPSGFAQTITEFSVPNYARQPISFAKAVNGFSRNANAWNFGFGFGGTIAGRAIFDAPTAGNLLLILPHHTPRPTPGGGPTDAGDVGDITILLAALASYSNSDSFSGTLAAHTPVGSTYNSSEIIGTYSSANGAPAGASVIPLPGGGTSFRFVYSSTVTSGFAPLPINRGVLQAGAVT